MSKWKKSREDGIIIEKSKTDESKSRGDGNIIEKSKTDERNPEGMT